MLPSSASSLPAPLIAPMFQLKRALATLCPVVASVHMMLHLERIVLLVEPHSPAIRRARIIRIACREYRGMAKGDWQAHRRKLGTLLDRFELTLRSAPPSEAAVRLCVAWEVQSASKGGSSGAIGRSAEQ